MKKSDITDDEQRQILAAIARDEEAYPRDRIAAVRALQDIAKTDADDVDREFADLIQTK